MIGRSRWISSMKRMSPSRWFVSIPTRSAGFSSTGPDVVLMFTPISSAISDGERGLAQAGRAVEEDVVERLAPALGGLDRDQALGPEARLDLLVIREGLGGRDFGAFAHTAESKGSRGCAWGVGSKPSGTQNTS
jgi:hypothetical protein